MERQEVNRIIEEKLRELNLDTLFEMFNKEHNPLDGTHKENIGEYVDYDDIRDKPLTFEPSVHSYETTVKARAYLSADQDDIADATWTTVQLNAVSFNPGGYFDISTYKFTAPVRGVYLILALIKWSELTADKKYFAGIYKNGSTQISAGINHPSHVGTFSCIDPDGHLLEVGDTIELKAYHDVGAATPDIGSGEANTRLLIHLLSV